MNVSFTLSLTSLTFIMFDYVAQISPLPTSLFSFLPLITQGLFFNRLSQSHSHGYSHGLYQHPPCTPPLVSTDSLHVTNLSCGAQ